MSAQRNGLEAVPCTSTTGMRPRRCGSSANRWSLALGSFRLANALLSRPDSSRVQPFPSTAKSARTAVCPYSSGTSCPPIRMLPVS